MKNKKNIKVRKIVANVKGIEIEFDEYYVIDENTGEEIFDRNIEIDNDIRLFDIYKKQMNLLTTTEIKNIRKKYDMNQKEFALSIGVGEITIHRFENGSIQTEAVDSIIRLSENPDIMYNLLIKNKSNFTKSEFNNLLSKVNELKRIKNHKIANFDINEISNLNFNNCSTIDVTNRLIMKYNKQIDNMSKKYFIDDKLKNAEYITPLKLQKLLYYVQGLSLYVFNKPAFLDNFRAWQYGPVVEHIYQIFNGRTPINNPKNDKKLCDGLEKIIDIVVSSYGQIETSKLVDLTHDEEPWIKTKTFEIINTEDIKNYFTKVYNLK